MTKSRKNNTSDKNNRVKARSLRAQNPDTQERVVSKTNEIGSPVCGVETKKGKTCKQPAMANGRCRFHGGKYAGAIMARPGNRNAIIHGAYLPGIQDEREQKAYDLFLSDLYEVFPDLNKASDLRHAQMAAFTYIRLIRALWGDASSSTIDDLSRAFTRHLAAIRVNRDQRVGDGEGKDGPMSPAEYAVEIMQQVRMYSSGKNVTLPIDPAKIGLGPSKEVSSDAW